jgi:U3 small nucleolar RNA-associated protein 7
MTHLFPSTATHSTAFCPFEDTLGVGHARGITSLIVPGAGEASFDSLEADPFESKKARREREVIGLLDKLQPDQIHLDADFIGKLAARKDQTPSAASIALGQPAKKPKRDFSQMSRVERLEVNDENEDPSESEEDVEAGPGLVEKVKKPRGRNKVLKRVLRRKRNIIDEKTMRARELIDQRRKEATEKRKQADRAGAQGDGGALDRFV